MTYTRSRFRKSATRVGQHLLRNQQALGGQFVKSLQAERLLSTWPSHSKEPPCSTASPCRARRKVLPEPYRNSCPPPLNPCHPRLPEPLRKSPCPSTTFSGHTRRRRVRVRGCSLIINDTITVSGHDAPNRLPYLHFLPTHLHPARRHSWSHRPRDSTSWMQVQLFQCDGTGANPSPIQVLVSFPIALLVPAV